MGACRFFKWCVFVVGARGKGARGGKDGGGDDGRNAQRVEHARRKAKKKGKDCPPNDDDDTSAGENKTSLPKTRITHHTPTRPVALAYPSAAKISPCSCRHSTLRTVSLRVSAWWISMLAPPG